MQQDLDTLLAIWGGEVLTISIDWAWERLPPVPKKEKKWWFLMFVLLCVYMILMVSFYIYDWLRKKMHRM